MRHQMRAKKHSRNEQHKWVFSCISKTWKKYTIWNTSMHIKQEKEEEKAFRSQVRSFIKTMKLKHKHKHLQRKRKRERHKKGDGKGKHDFILLETALKVPGHFTVHTSLCTSKTGFFVFSKHKSGAYFNFFSPLAATWSILKEPKHLILTYKTLENWGSHVQLSEVTTWHLPPSYFS